MNRSAIVNEIIDLKKENDAIILAHNYQIPEIQDIADFVGDSLDLSIKATNTDAEIIVFCGVDFMAESAKILNPDKTVILPVIDAECPMANMVKTDNLKKLKKDYPKAEVVAYINTTIDTKILSDICCTSANGQKVVNSLDSKEIIFVPDRNLGSYIQRSVKDKKMILWPGTCPTHNKIKKDEILKLKKDHPDAEILVHPECRPEVIDVSDKALSTNGMINYSKESKAKEFIIGTEKDLCYRLLKENPNKKFYPLKSAICPNMKKITLEKVLNSLKTIKPEIEFPIDKIEKAKQPLQRMMDLGRGD